MKIINKFVDIEALPIPDDVKAKMLGYLIEPFGEVDAAQSMWDELGVSLYLIEQEDTDDSLATGSESSQYFIQFISDYPEWVFLLNAEGSPWLLALAITTSEGCGAYLCAPMGHQALSVIKLAAQVEV